MGKNKEVQKLTAKEELFLDEYMEDFNATRAYIEAYDYKGPNKNARSLASRTLRKQHIKEELERRRKELREEHNLYMESLIEQLKRIAFLNPKYLVSVKKNVVLVQDTKEIPQEMWSAIKSIKEGKNGIEIEFHDKMKAIELLVKYCGLYNEKLDVNNKISFDFSMFDGKDWEEIEAIAGLEDWKDTKKEDKKDG